MRLLAKLFIKHKFGKTRLKVLENWIKDNIDCSVHMENGFNEEYLKGYDTCLKHILEAIKEVDELGR